MVSWDGCLVCVFVGEGEAQRFRWCTQVHTASKVLTIVPRVLPSEGLDCEVSLKGLPAQTLWLWVSLLAMVAGTLVSPPEGTSELAGCVSLLSELPWGHRGQAQVGTAPPCWCSLGPS